MAVVQLHLVAEVQKALEKTDVDAEHDLLHAGKRWLHGSLVDEVRRGDGHRMGAARQSILWIDERGFVQTQRDERWYTTQLRPLVALVAACVASISS